MTPAVRDVLTVASGELGVVETGGSNRGPRVEEYLRTVHLPPGAPWCAAFVAWCGLHGAGGYGGWPLPAVGGCMSLYGAGQKLGIVALQPTPGAVFLKWFPALKRFAHTGFVEQLDDRTWVTLEGNTNPDGGREGYGVFRRRRTFAAEDRFLDWWTVLGRQR